MTPYAVIQKQEYLALLAPHSFVAWIYDKDQPRQPGAVDPTTRYVCVDMLGPFKSLIQAQIAVSEKLT